MKHTYTPQPNANSKAQANMHASCPRAINAIKTGSAAIHGPWTHLITANQMQRAPHRVLLIRQFGHQALRAIRVPAIQAIRAPNSSGNLGTKLFRQFRHQTLQVIRAPHYSGKWDSLGNGATWSWCRIGEFCVHHTTMHHITSLHKKPHTLGACNTSRLLLHFTFWPVQPC